MLEAKYPYRVEEGVPLYSIDRDAREALGTDSEIMRLQDSIKKHGLIRPLMVTELQPERYLLIDGYRRYRCLERLGLATVPCFVWPRLSEDDVAELRFEANVSWTSEEE